MHSTPCYSLSFLGATGAGPVDNLRPPMCIPQRREERRQHRRLYSKPSCLGNRNHRWEASTAATARSHRGPAMGVVREKAVPPLLKPIAVQPHKSLVRSQCRRLGGSLGLGLTMWEVQGWACPGGRSATRGEEAMQRQGPLCPWSSMPADQGPPCSWVGSAATTSRRGYGSITLLSWPPQPSGRNGRGHCCLRSSCALA